MPLVREGSAKVEVQVLRADRRGVSGVSRHGGALQGAGDADKVGAEGGAMNEEDVNRLLAEREARDAKADAWDALLGMYYGRDDVPGREPMHMAQMIHAALIELERDNARKTERIKTLTSEIRTHKAMVEELSRRLKASAKEKP